MNPVIEKDFIKMIQQHERIIYKIASFYASNTQPLNDLYQEVVLNLWKSFPNFRNESLLSTWVYKVALNTCIGFLRRKQGKPHYVEIPWDFPSETTSDEHIKELYALIDKLGKLEKALILLYLEDKSQKEMAEITGLSVTNVATKLSRIKEKLKNMSNQ